MLVFDFFQHRRLPLGPVSFIQKLFAFDIIEGDPNGRLIQRLDLQYHDLDSAYLGLVDVALPHDVNNNHISIKHLLHFRIAHKYFGEQVGRIGGDLWVQSILYDALRNNPLFFTLLR